MLMRLSSKSLGKILSLLTAKGAEARTSNARLTYVKHLVYVADLANTVYDADSIRKISEILYSIPGQDSIATFYDALAAQKYGKGNVNYSVKVLDSLLTGGPPRIRTRAALTLGTINYRAGDYDAAKSFYAEAVSRVLKDGQDWYTAINAQKMIAVVEGIEGNHSGALIRLNNLFPLARTMGKYYPAIFCDHLNSMAVEMMEVGNTDEAAAVCSMTLASPFTKAYPVWHETWLELQERKRCRYPVVFSGESNTACETVELDLAKISLPESYVSIQTDQLVSYRKRMYWPENLPWEAGTLSRFVDYKQTKEATMKDTKEAPKTIEEIQKLPTAEQQVEIIKLLLTLQEGDEAFAKILSIWIKPHEIRKALMDLVLSSTATQEKIDQTLSFFCSLKDESKEDEAKEV